MDYTKKRILKVTIELFSEKGPEKVTMRDIASKCNISLGNLTYYFNRKEDIFAAAFEELIQREYNHYLQYYTDSDENPWISFIAVNYAHLKAATCSDTAISSYIYATNFPSSRESYVQVSSNLLYRCLENTPYTQDRESVWLASLIGCGGEFEAINAYRSLKGRYDLDELIIPTFSVRMFLLDCEKNEISRLIKEGIKKGNSIYPELYNSGLFGNND